MDELTKLKALAEEAAGTVAKPRAKKCWPWSHDWTKWEVCRDPTYPSLFMAQRRHCMGCGLAAYRRIQSGS